MESDITVQLDEIELVSGLTIETVMAECLENPEEVNELENARWSQCLVIDPRVRLGTRLAVRQQEGRVTAFEFFQQSPFSPGKILCDLQNQNGELIIRHLALAQEGEHKESFPTAQREQFEQRIAQLFRQYFVSGA